MAATNPFRVSDLIKKYGWQIMVYLSNLGVQTLAESQVLFVDSGNTTNGLDADDGEHGHSFEKPLLTLDYAIGLCTADEGSIILLAPGHNENIADGETIDFDANGITCIGLGTGTLRPRFDFDAASSTIDIGGNNVTLANLTFMPGAGDVLIGIDIETTKTNTRIVDCEFLEGEASGDEFLAAIELKASCHDTVIENNVFRAGWSSNPDDGISLKGASNRVTIKGNRFSGPYGDGEGVTAAISNSSGVCLDLLIENNIMKVKDGESGIEVIATTPAICRHNTIVSTGCTIDNMIVATIGELDQNIGITTDGTSGEFIKGGAISPEVVQYNLDHLVKTADGSDVYPASVTTNSILGMIMSTDGDVSNFSKTTDSLQSIRDAITGIGVPTDVTGAVGTSPTARSLQDILEKDDQGTFDDAYDSLEAISDFIRTGTSLGAGIQLDHLQATTTSVDADGDLSTYAVTKSLLAHIMSKTATTSTYQCSTDSLEAIGDAVSGFSSAVSQTPTARSLHDILEKDGGGTFNCATDSLEAIADAILTGTDILAGVNLDHLMKTAVVDEQDMSAEIATGSALAHILVKGASGDVNDFDPTTDSLQAIRDNQQAAARAAIDDAELDHLCELDGTEAYAENIANDSIVAKIMCEGATATANTYNNTTDSLEAISNLLRTGTAALAGLQLDHFLANTTSVAAGSDLEEFAVAGSLMSHLASVGADITTFDARTDSLEAISNKAGGFSGDGGANFDDSIYANLVLMSKFIADGDGDFATGRALPSDTSLVDIIGNFTGAYNGTDPDDNIKAALDHLSKYIVDGTGDWASGSNLPDNKSLYDILGTAYIADGGADDEDTIKAHLDLIYTDSQAIVADTAAIDPGAKRLIQKSLASIANGDNALFVISHPVRAKIWGIVTGVIENKAVNLKLQATPTSPGGDIDITANLDCDNDAAGTVYKCNTTLGGAMVEVTGGATLIDGIEIFLPAGTVQLVSGAAATGTLTWYCQYEPLIAGAAVTAAG